MPENKEDSTAKINFKQAIIVALITSVTTIMVTLISTSGNSSENSSNSKVCSELEKKIKGLEAKLELTISAENFTLMSKEFFAKAKNKEVLIESILNVVNLAEAHVADTSQYAYNLFLLKQILINKPRRNINTRTKDNKVSTYKLIQKILKNIGFYSGDVSGKQLDTYFALKEFQETRNAVTENYFEERNIGILGNKTYIAIMEEYERIN